MDSVHSAGQRLVNILSDDAEDGTDICRLNALRLLSMVTSLARSQKSNFVVESLVKANMLEIVMEPLRNVAIDFASTSVEHRAYLLTIFESRMFLLLQISRTRVGATSLLESGLLQSVRDSMIFRADPDLGMDLDTTTKSMSATSIVNPSSSTSMSALQNYFTLLAATLRVLLSTFYTRGLENEQVQYLMRTFLVDHRSNMVGIFKKAAGVNGKIGDATLHASIDECVRCYTGLAVGCDFVDLEDESALEGLRSSTGFT